MKVSRQTADLINKLSSNFLIRLCSMVMKNIRRNFKF